MAYASVNFKTKKALKEAIARGDYITVYSPGPFGCQSNGIEFLEGPHYPQPHRWYAKAEIKDGQIVKVN